MSLFKGVERKIEGVVEGGFGRAFKSSVQPVELAHKLAKEMGDHKTVGVANVYVPNEFDIYLGRDDYRQLSGLSESLKGELSSYLIAFARREGWTLAAPPQIELHEDTDLHLGEFGIGTRTVSVPAQGAEEAAPAAVAAPAAPVADHTVLYEEPRARAAGPRARLRGDLGQWELTAPVTVVGRSRRCDIVIDDPNVSRRHIEITRQGDGFMVRDLGSTNGARLNQRPIQQEVLQNGDQLELGTSRLVFELIP